LSKISDEAKALAKRYPYIPWNGPRSHGYDLLTEWSVKANEMLNTLAAENERLELQLQEAGFKKSIQINENPEQR
jgi:hypothetical protein